MQSFTSCCLSLQKVTDVSTFHHLHGFHPDASFYCYSLTWLSPKASWQSNQMTLSKCKLDYIHHWFGFSSSLVTFRRQQGLQSPSDTGPSQAPWLLSLFFHRSVVLWCTAWTAARQASLSFTISRTVSSPRYLVSPNWFPCFSNTHEQLSALPAWPALLQIHSRLLSNSSREATPIILFRSETTHTHYWHYLTSFLFYPQIYGFLSYYSFYLNTLIITCLLLV